MALWSQTARRGNPVRFAFVVKLSMPVGLGTVLQHSVSCFKGRWQPAVLGLSIGLSSSRVGVIFVAIPLS